MDPVRSDAADQLALAKAWLYGPEGTETARGLLRRFRIASTTIDFEADLQAEALKRMWRRIERHGPVAELNPGAYLTIVMTNILRDIARGRRTGLAVDPFADYAQDPAAAAVDIDDPAAHELGAALCAAIESTDAPDWVKAAAVVYVTVLAYPGLVVPSYPAPRPVKGANEQEAALWLALWFAGRRAGLFDADGETDAARMRKARSRAGTQVKQLVDNAASAVRWGRSDG